MTLRAKTFLLTASGLGALLLVLYAVTAWVLLRDVRKSEIRQANQNLIVARLALQGASRTLAQDIADYGTWTDTYNFVQNPTQSYISENYNQTWLRDFDMDYLAILGSGGRVVWEAHWDVTKGILRPVPPQVRRLYGPNSIFVKHQNPHQSVAGLMASPVGTLLVTAAPITKSDYSGGIRGSFFAARSLNVSRLFNIMRGANCTVQLLPLSGGAKKVSASTTFLTTDEQNVVAQEPFNDIYGQPRWILQVAHEAQIYQQFSRTLLVWAAVLITAWVLCCIFALWPIEALVLRRISALSGDVRQIRRQGSRSARVVVRGQDELGALASDINATLDSLALLDKQKIESEALHREMVQTALTAGDCFFIYESASRVMQWHGDIDGQLGYAQNALPRSLEAWQTHIHPEDRPVVERVYGRALEDGAPFELEIRVLRADGETLFWMHRGKALVDNRQVKLLGVCLDITARKTSEAARRRTEARLARIVETAPDAILLFDAQGQVIFANAGASATFGCPVEELWSRRYDSAKWDERTLDGQPLEAKQTAFMRVAQEKVAVRDLQQLMSGPDGKTLVVSVNAAPLPDENGEFAGVVASFTDITSHLDLQKRLAHQAFHDALTGLANRELMRDRLAHALALSKRTDSEIGLLFIDLDNFKWVNDSLGHAAGDDLLCEVAARLRHSLRESDTAARFGGDEFVVLLESVENPAYSLVVAERLVQVLSEPFQVAGREVFTSPSIGLTFSDKECDVDSLLRQADAAMYEAKRRGKGRFEIFQQNLSAAAMERLDIEADLRRALTGGEFFLVYQPKIDLQTGEVGGVEALVRWLHPTKGLVPPAQFITIAEETGLIVPLGHWVLQAGCAQMQEWNRGREMLGLAPLKLAVNVSPRQFHTTKMRTSEASPELPPLAREIEIILAQTGLRPSDLVLEITESVLMERTQESLQILRALKSLGVELAIDDFGTGYSSLAYLRSFPFDYLKIDREFVAHIDSESGPSVIVGSIISLSHALGLKVIAEGAERPEEIAKLRTLNCNFAQGYYFSRPMPGREIERLLFPDLASEKNKPRVVPRLVR